MFYADSIQCKNFDLHQQKFSDKVMVASKITDVINADVADNASPALGCSSSVPCSICFDLVIDEGERSTAKLQCGHKFHLGENHFDLLFRFKL